MGKSGWLGRNHNNGCRLSTAMGKPKRYKNRIELLDGTLDALILQTLRWGSQHGYGIGQAIRAGFSLAINICHSDAGSQPIQANAAVFSSKSFFLHAVSPFAVFRGEEHAPLCV